MKFLKHLNEAKKHFISDSNDKRIGIVHYIYKGDKTVYVDDDVSNEHKKLIIDEFEKLEDEIYDLIDKKSKEFDLFLKKNNFESSMGNIGYKEK